MSMYTTGELAKLCGVTVRTVQYYDSRSILLPSRLSEGGRRLYSEDDLRKMKTICFLRSLGLSIDSIREILDEAHPEQVIALILQQQETALRSEIKANEKKLALIEDLRQGIKLAGDFSADSISDIAGTVDNRKKLRKVHSVMIVLGVIMDIIEIGTLILGISKVIWWPFAVGLPVIITLGVWISMYYFRNTLYICPECHKVFRPGIKEAIFATHTPATRKLKCPECGHKGYCVEIYGKTEIDFAKTDAAKLELGFYYPECIPDGYTKVFVSEYDNRMQTVVYENPQGAELRYIYETAGEGGQVSFENIRSEETVDINGSNGTLSDSSRILL